MDIRAEGERMDPGGASLGPHGPQCGCSSGASLGALWPGVLGEPQGSCSQAPSCPRTGRRCVSQAWSRATFCPPASPRPCLPSPPLEPAAGMAGRMLRHPQFPGESSPWLCNLHQWCFLKHYGSMWTLPAWAAPCPEGLELGSAIFPSCGVCQPQVLPSSIPWLAPGAPRPHVPGTAEVPRSQSSWLFLPAFWGLGVPEGAGLPSHSPSWSAGAQSLGSMG